MRMWQRAALAAIALGSSIAAYWSVRFAYAEALYGRGTPVSVERACALAPGNAAYHERRAALNDARAEESLEAALRANPADAEALIELGLRAEMRQDFASAERRLLEAARRDRRYDPRWSLANYYFRRQDGGNFWKWAREACDTAYEPSPVFRLMWAYEDNPQAILARGVPDEPKKRRDYLAFLLWNSHWEAAGETVAGMLERGPEAEDSPLLLAYCDRLLAAKRGSEARAVWNALAQRKLIASAALEDTPALLNGDFVAPPGNSGFDWRVATVEGVSVSHGAPGLRLSFSGQQQERCELLSQYVLLKAGARHRLSFGYLASGIGLRSGLRWQVLDVTREPAVIAESEDLAGEDWRDGSVSFTAPANTSLNRIVLSYRRAPGTTRIEGLIRLRKIALGREN